MRFVRQFEQTSPHFVLVFASGGASFVEKSAMLLYARCRGAKTLMFLRHGAFINHCRESVAYKFFVKLMLRGVSAHLCQSPTWRNFFVSELGLPAPHCRVVENWTVTDELLAIGRVRTYSIRRPVRFLFVGWLEKAKGVRDLIAAFRELPSIDGLPQPELIFAGSGSLESYCRKFASEPAFIGRVDVAGWVTGIAKDRLLADADVFVLPSHAEGLSNAMLEAMAAGLPVIVSRVGSLPDVIAHDINGLLMNPGDIEELTALMHMLATDANRRERLGRAANARAAAFTPECAAGKLLETMDGLRPITRVVAQ
jgi:glycosyltransferase involved in cell wall biosynthesis